MKRTIILPKYNIYLSKLISKSISLFSFEILSNLMSIEIISVNFWKILFINSFWSIILFPSYSVLFFLYSSIFIIIFSKLVRQSNFTVLQLLKSGEMFNKLSIINLSI